jgi:hypothetical protein
MTKDDYWRIGIIRRLTPRPGVGEIDRILRFAVLQGICDLDLSHPPTLNGLPWSPQSPEIARSVEAVLCGHHVAEGYVMSRD